jgi:hypothetical protein
MRKVAAAFAADGHVDGNRTRPRVARKTGQHNLQRYTCQTQQPTAAR